MKGSGTVIYKGVLLQIEFDHTPVIPEVWTLSNGDPGYPAQGGDFDIESVKLDGSDVEIFEFFSEEQLTEIENAYITQNNDYDS